MTPMLTLNPLWRFIESRPQPVAVLDEWRRCMGGVFPAVKPLLRATGERALSYPNPNPHGVPLRVVRHRDGAVVAVCTEDAGTRIRLVETDLALFALDMKLLRRAICDALGLEVSRGPADEGHSLLHIGSWTPKPAASFPVVMIRCSGARPLMRAVQHLVATAGKPTLIMTPTRTRWPDGLADDCQKQKCLLVDLESLIKIDGTAWIANDDWQACLAAFCRYADLALPASFGNKRPKRKRADRAAKIEAVRRELVDHIRSARDHAHSLAQSDREPRLLKRPTKADLARGAGIKDYDLTRCFDDEPQLIQLWNIADDLELVMRYGR